MDYFFETPKCKLCGHGIEHHKGPKPEAAPCYINKCGCPCFVESFDKNPGSGS